MNSTPAKLMYILELTMHQFNLTLKNFSDKSDVGLSLHIDTILSRIEDLEEFDDTIFEIDEQNEVGIRGIQFLEGQFMLEELWKRFKFEKDNHAKEELVMKCMPLVKSLAQRFSVYSSPCCDSDDLVSAGIMGLLDALEKYNPIEQTSFRTYAKCRVRGAMLDEIRNLKWAPRSIQEKIRALRNAHAQLEQALERPPFEEELAESLNMSLEQFRKMMIQIGPSAIFMHNIHNSEDDDNSQFEANFEDTEAINPAEHVVSEETKSILVDTIKSLSEKEALVVSLYYYEEMTMKEIGKILTLTESRVCQIHAKALLNLFQALHTKVSYYSISI